MLCLVTLAHAGGAAISAGHGHSLLIQSDGTLWSWGANEFGQLGDGGTSARSSPAVIGHDFVLASAGHAHSVALKIDGSLWAWGRNDRGQIGDGTTTDRPNPVKIGDGFKFVSTSSNHTLAIKANDTLWAWGDNAAGQLGIPGAPWLPSPQQTAVAGATAVAAGTDHSVALTDGGSLWTWGNNEFGQLADLSVPGRAYPVQIGSGYTAIAAGAGTTAAIDGSGTLWMTGNNNHGQLGDGTMTLRQGFARIGSGFSSISLGNGFSLAVKQDGSLWSWGRNDQGQLGNALRLDSAAPEQIGTGFVIAAAGDRHGLAMRSEGSSWIWGDNDSRQLGSTSTDDQLYPTPLVRAEFILPSSTVQINQGWNLLGNSSATPIQISAALAGNTDITSVWKWLPGQMKWAFYSPILSIRDLEAYAASKGYALLAVIEGGEGFWINARNPTNFSFPEGDAILSSNVHTGLVSGWNLLAIGQSRTPAQINQETAFRQPDGSLANGFISLWAWDNARSNWYFFAPALATQGNTALSDYTKARGYLDFASEGESLKPARGFWLNRPPGGSTSALTEGPFSHIGSCQAGVDQQKISLVHVGDLHANFNPTEGKYGRIRGYFEAVHAENPNSVFTNAGDDYEKGSVAEQLSQGRAALEATFAMRFDVRTIGNHDFAWGEQQLLEFSRDPHSIVLMSNARYNGSDERGLGSHAFKTLQIGCAKVGFFGMVSKPWNELDETYADDYFQSFHMDYDYISVAQRIVDQYRQHVDLMVMVSHLGIGNDLAVAKAVPGIDLVLGGHTHGGPEMQTVGTSTIVQPDFYADGVTRIDIDFDVASKKILSINRTEVPVAELTGTSADVVTRINDIMKRYAPESNKPLAYVESSLSPLDLVGIAAKAGMFAHSADAALLDPAQANPYFTLPPGEFTQEKAISAYFVERQKPGTPGINSFYLMEISGTGLEVMRAAQPTWVYAGPANLDPGATYKVLLHKAAALHPERFFSATPRFSSPQPLSETWWALDRYARYRHAACLYFDSDTKPPSCRTDKQISVWQFSDPTQPFKAQTGTALMAFHDPNQTGWSTSSTLFGTAAEFGIPNPALPNALLLEFPATTQEQGLSVTHSATPNGDFAFLGRLSQYTLVMDIYWPLSSEGQWRSLLQTQALNTDDGDWFIRGIDGGMGIGAYFGKLQTGRWYRLAMVAQTAIAGGTLKFYIDGQLVGEKSGADERWALASRFLLLTDNDRETAAGYLAGALFADYPLSDYDIAALGNAQQTPISSGLQ